MTASVRTARVFAALHERNYRLFWFGQVVSVTGTWVQTVALGWLVLTLTDSPLALGVMSALQFTPVLFLSPFAGVLADRASKRLLLLWAQVGMMILALVLGLLTVADVIAFWQIVVLTGLLGLCNAVDMPVRQAFVSEMVDREHVLNAVALNSTLFNLGRIAGPAIAGGILAWQGPGPAFLVNAASFLAVFVGLLLMDESTLHARRKGSGGSVIGDLRDGIRYVIRERELGLLILLVGGLSIFCMNFNVLLPVFERDVLEIGPLGLGVITASLAVGSLVAALTMASRRAYSIGTLLAGGALLALAEFVVAGSSWVWLTLPFLALTGAGMITFASNANTTLQVRAPDELRGRVMSLYMTVFVGSTPIGGLLMGFFADLWGAPVALAIGAGCGCTVLATVGLALARRERGDAWAEARRVSAES